MTIRLGDHGRGGRRLVLVGMVCASASLAPPLRAQDPPAARVPVACSGQRVTNIVVLTQPPYTDRLPESLDFVRRAMVKTHANTRDEVVRRFLLFGIGDACTELARLESERILRVQPFLVDASVRAFDDGAGGVELEVETRDEFSIVGDVRINGKAPMFRGLSLGESNLAGRGVYAALQWRDGLAYNDLVGARFVDHQFLGQRNVARLFATRAPLGHEFGGEVLRPYYTDLQQVAWRAGYGGVRDFVRFVRDADEGTAVALRRTFGDIGAVWRVGEPGRLRLVGASLTRERSEVDSRPVFLTREGFREDSLAASFPSMYRTADVTRFNALVGMRRLSFMRVEGFDALTGVQDVPVGMQAALMVGRSVPLFGSRDNDWFVRHGLYAGAGTPRSFVGMETITEARRNDNGAWDGVMSSGRLAWYYKPWRNQLSTVALDWGAGWSVRVPYQLSFSDPMGGLIGYRRSRVAGAHRAVVRLEQRWLPTPRTTIGDLGLAFFADVGRLWAGDVPYAMDSPVRATVGVGVLAAVPRRSRRLWRVDFGFPLGGDPNSAFEVRFRGADFTRIFSRESRDIEQARERSLPRSLFTWP